MQALVIDTNVVLDLFVFGDPRVAAVREALAAGHCRWIGCPAMRGELADVLNREPCRSRVADPAAVLAAYDSAVVVLGPPPSSALLCSDADDQVFLDLAVAHRAHALLTRDRALLRLASRARRFGVVVATPERWLAAAR